MISIEGIIHSEKDTTGSEKRVSLVDVIAQVRKEPEGGELTVLIRSIGGMVEEGFKIYDYLRSLGRPIKTVAVGECASIATVIFLAGDTRIAECDLMIHNPWTTIQGDAAMLKEGAELMQQAEKRMEKFYSEKTGLSAETLSDLMARDRVIARNEAVSLGFATTAGDLKPLAMISVKPTQTTMSTDKKPSAVDRFLAACGLMRIQKEDGVEALAMQLETAAGVTLTIEREDGAPQVGDKAIPDGEHLMPDSTTIIVTDGVITEILPEGEDGTLEDQLAAKNRRIEELEGQLAAKNTATPQDQAVLNAVNAMGGMEVLRKLQSGYKAMKRDTTQAKDAKVSKTSQKLQAAKEKRANS